MISTQVQEKLLSKFNYLELIEYNQKDNYVGSSKETFFGINTPYTRHNPMATLGITSRQNGYHMLLLDFTHPVTPGMTDTLVKQLPQGLLVNSGQSYHFYSYDLYCPTKWQKQMHEALLLPGIDFRYIGHRLLDGYGTLRISTAKNKPYLPRIITEIL